MAGNHSVGITLKVTPVQLKSKADEVSNVIREMRIAFNELGRIVSRTSYYWKGEAGMHCRTVYEEDKKKAEDMLNRLREHPRDLLQMAQGYKGVEGRVMEISSALPGDVIS